MTPFEDLAAAIARRAVPGQTAYRDFQYRMSQRAAHPRRPFGSGNLGSGIQWDACQPAQTITIQVIYTQSVTFYGTLFGKAIV